MYAAFVASIIALAVYLFSRTVNASPTLPISPEAEKSVSTVREIFERVGAKYGVDPDLIHAHAIAESNMDANAVRWNPPRDVSVGLLQILCVPPEGYTREQAEVMDYTAMNKFNIEPWPVSFSQLKDPELNITLAAQIIAWNLSTYSFPRGVAIYNDWSARTAPVEGPFPNQKYVDKVLRNLSTLKGV